LLRRFSEAVLGDAELSLVGAVVNGAAALAMLPTSAPDVVLLDLGLPDMGGIEVIRNIAAHNPQREVLVVTMFADDQHVFEALEAGATGYLLKDLGLDRIASSIPELRAGGSPISPSSARRPANRGPPGAKSALLTPREIELLRLTAKGLSFDNVGELMGVSPHTVVAHVKKIYRKLAVHSRGEAVFEATQMGRL
jgi:DNA-binding NarL/FixJ family response regulator